MLELSEKYINVSVGQCNEINADIIAIDGSTSDIVFISALGFDSYIKASQRILSDKQGNSAYLNRRYYGTRKDYRIITKKTSMSDYTHMIAYAEDVYSINRNNESFTTYIYTQREEDVEEEVYKRLNKYSSVPMLREWTPYVIEKLTEAGQLREMQIIRYIPQDIAHDFIGYTLSASRAIMLNIIQEGLRNKRISIDNTSQPSAALSGCTGIDSYLNVFGEGLARKIQDSFRPKFIPGEDNYDTYSKNIDDYIHYKTGKELYEAQRSTIQAIVNNMKVNSNTIVCGEMGSGKTIMAGSACYAHNSNKNKGFNAIVMCPSHLVENWKHEMEEHIPNAKCYIVHNTEELLELKPKLLDKYKIENSFVIISKEWAKIGYSYRPAVQFKRVAYYNNIKYKNVFVCPKCGKILMKTISVPANNWSRRKVKRQVPMELLDFATQNLDNMICTNTIKEWDNKKEIWINKQCDNKLWTALNRDDDTNDWIKLGKNGWVMKRHIEPIMNSLLEKEHLTTKESSLMESLMEQYNLLQNGEELAVHFKGSKKYPMAKYIKERMGGVFDYFIADEMHKLKGGSTDQGQAFHYLIQAAKKTIGLTGTILNGMANSIYYILYRMCPGTMRAEGFKYEDEAEFSRIFGVYSNSSRTASDGTKIGSTKQKLLPGISSLVFTKFLLNNTVFISLEDMTEGLPSYTEIPLGVDMDEEQIEGYQMYERYFNTVNNNGENLKIMGSLFKDMGMYPDAPHSVKNLYDKETQDLMFAPNILQESTRPKETELLSIIEERVGAGEKVLVYYKDVNKSNLGRHLTNLISNEGYDAAELKASVSAEKRESYIKGLVNKGLDVLICNPSLVETGLNLLDFTTIVFFQMGYDLSTMRQASRRSWRLSQTKDIYVYFLYYKNTIQEDVLSLMATKLHAAQSMEGKFSEEGLKAMSNNQDMLTQIAANVVDGIRNTVDSTLFSSSNYVKKAANNIRDHEKTLERIEIDMNEYGRRILGSVNKVKTPQLDYNKSKNPLKLFI